MFRRGQVREPRPRPAGANVRRLENACPLTPVLLATAGGCRSLAGRNRGRELHDIKNYLWGTTSARFLRLSVDQISALAARLNAVYLEGRSIYRAGRRPGYQFRYISPVRLRKERICSPPASRGHFARCRHHLYLAKSRSKGVLISPGTPHRFPCTLPFCFRRSILRKRRALGQHSSWRIFKNGEAYKRAPDLREGRKEDLLISQSGKYPGLASTATFNRYGRSTAKIKS